jgi:hypothetical protein
VYLQDLHFPLAHLGDEIEVIVLGLTHPDHIVEQQFVAVAGRRPLEG